MPTIRTVHNASTFAFTPRGPADRELEWFFTMAESDMGDRSTYVAMLSPARPWGLDDDALDMRAEAVHAQRKVRSWLVELGDHDAGVLQAAYLARPWPRRLREELGRLTGIVVRMGASECGPLPDDGCALDVLERQAAERLEAALGRGEPVVRRLQEAASPLLKRAFDGYARQRGGRERPVLEGVS